MTAPLGSRSRGLTRLAAVLLVSCAFWAIAAAPASAADATTTPVQQLQQGPLLSFTCNDCHATISDNLVPNHIFSHGAHMTYDCTACHPRFPHNPTGTDRPKMPSCFSCHGLRHGPQGIVAGPECTKCHTLPRAQLIPLDHQVPGYAGKGHVAAGQTQYRTSCMMCHTQAQCDACHVKNKISWETTQSPTYDPGDSCLSCHKAELPRIVAPVTASRLDSSAHRDLGCAQCHPDFRYDDGPNATRLWNANAGLACADPGCHDSQNALWEASIHAATTGPGGVPAATCSGCHGGHDIERLKTQAAKNRLRLSGQQMCVGNCHTHEAAYASYNDYYHGAAYKAGALDAPACWTCHGAHNALGLKDAKSMTSPENLPATCGQTGCHGGSTETFAEDGRTMIHGLVAQKAANPIMELRARLFPAGR
jgi:hypothetical protein